MKKVIAVMLALVLTFSLSGCGLFDAIGDYFESPRFERDVEDAVEDLEDLLDY